MFCLPCLTLILYFVILGIFMPSKRQFIKGAILCFWRKLTLHKCTDAFDILMHTRFVMWIAGKNRMSLSKFFKKKRNFDIALAILGLVFMVLNTVLFYLLYRFLFIKSPCNEGACQI